MDFISGEDRGQTLLLPDSLEDYVGKDNPVRVIDAFANGLEMHGLGFSGAAPNDTGRPSYDPAETIRLRIHVSGALVPEAGDGDEKKPRGLLGRLSLDHKTISRFRRDNGKALKNTFRAFVGLCANLGRYGNVRFTYIVSILQGVNHHNNFAPEVAPFPGGNFFSTSSQNGVIGLSSRRRSSGLFPPRELWGLNQL